MGPLLSQWTTEPKFWMLNVTVQHCQSKCKSVKAYGEFEKKDTTLSADLQPRQLRGGFTSASIQAAHFDCILYPCHHTPQYHVPAHFPPVMMSRAKNLFPGTIIVVRRYESMTSLGWLWPDLPHGWCWAASLPLMAFSFFLLCLPPAGSHCTVTSMLGFAKATAVIQQTYGNEKEYISAIRETSP